jgi:hypothetical protein
VGNQRDRQALFHASGDDALKFAKSTTNPQLAAVLIEKAADLKSQVDESNLPDAAPLAPDIEPPAR